MERCALTKLNLGLRADTTGVDLVPGPAVPRSMMPLKPGRHGPHALGPAVQLFLAQRA